MADTYPVVDDVKPLLGGLGGEINHTLSKLGRHLLSIKLARFHKAKLRGIHNFSFFTSGSNPKYLRLPKGDIINFAKVPL